MPPVTRRMAKSMEFTGEHDIPQPDSLENASKKQSEITAEKRGYEFFGPPGTLVLILVLPLVVYSLAFFCNDVSGCPVPSLLHPTSSSLHALKSEVGWPSDGIWGLFDVKVTGYVLGYYALLLLLQIYVPGIEAEGVELASGGRHEYKLNTFRTMLLLSAACIGGSYVYGLDFPLWAFVWNNYVQIITANMVISTAIAVFCYVRSFTVPPSGSKNPLSRELAPGGNSGNPIYDFFMGRELNPRVSLPLPFTSETFRTIDLKVFCELRPGMLGWLLLNISNVVHQYQLHGKVTLSILLVVFAQNLYILDSLYMEPAVLTTMDVVTDGFGFMLSFGDLVWVPFTFSLQTRYLAVYPFVMSWTGIAASLIVQAVGYYIFRSANNQKNRFRTDPRHPSVKGLRYIQTASGSKLLISGWWGKARHINYMGDWIMSCAYSIPTGISGYTILREVHPETGNAITPVVVQTPEVRGWGMLVTYFYLLYFAILLIHRERRDEEKCKRKYGRDWDRYTAIVKSRIVPGIY